MITSILELSSSPTQGKSKQYKCKVIDCVVEDDDHKVFPLEITYEYSPYYGLGWEISVWSYDFNIDFKINGTPNIGVVDLSNWVKDCIREHENCHVTFY